MSQELVRRVQGNLVASETTLAQDTGSAMMKAAAVGGVWTGVALLPFIGVPGFVPVLAVILFIAGFYLRWVK